MSSVWGKIGGAGIGFALGGPIGALLGALAGHFLIDSSGGLFSPPPRDVIFTTGLIALAAKMAKADGVVLQSEVDAFRTIVDVPPEEQPKVDRLFRLAQSTTDGFESYARQLAETFPDEPALLENVLDGLFHIAKADNAIHEAELNYLATVARIFGFSDAEFNRIRSRHVLLDDDPYLALGLNREMSDEDMKRAYHWLVAENHPDRQIALGLPPEAIRISTERLAAINAAWERIVTERQNKPSGD